MKASVGRIVHYVPWGSPVRPDGSQAFPSGQCRAATVTEVPEEGTAAYNHECVGLCVTNPTGLFFHPLTNGGVPYSEECRPGTWHWPERV